VIFTNTWLRIKNGSLKKENTKKHKKKKTRKEKICTRGKYEDTYKKIIDALHHYDKCKKWIPDPRCRNCFFFVNVE